MKSVEIARVSRDFTNPARHIFDVIGDNMQDSILVLQFASNEHQICLQDFVPKGFENARPNDDVVNPGLVFERTEDDALRGLRMLQVSH